MAVQQWSATDYAANGRFVADLGQPVVDLLQLRPGEHILDLGCGDGFLTAQLVEQGAIVVGVDVSPELLQAARARGLDVRAADASTLPFVGEFDAVFSNAVLHWIAAHGPVLEGVHRALRPGGRFVGEFGGHANVAAICTALRAIAARRGMELSLPWNYPTAEEFAERLGAAGFEVVLVQLLPRPTALPSGMAAWLRTFCGWAFDGLPEPDREPALAEVVELLRPALCDSRGRWTADYTRLRFSARRP